MLNLQRVLRRLEGVPRAIIAAASDQLDAETDDLADAVRRAVEVVTGKMQGSIHVEPGSHPLSRRIVVDDEGAPGEEFGHRAADGSHVPANPFLFPTYRARKRGIARRLKAAARKAIRSELARF